MFQACIETMRRRWQEPAGYGEVLQIGLPLVMSMASTTVMQFTDRLFLSRYSLDAIAAALPAGLVVVLFVLTSTGLVGYANVLIAQNLGAGHPKRVGNVLWQSLWLSVLLGLCIMALSMFAEPIFAFSGHGPKLQELERSYFSILCYGAVFPVLGSAMSSFFSGLGHTRPVMIANFMAMVINVPLDYVLIYGAWGFPELGISGAAIATVCGSALTVLILSLAIFTKHNEILYNIRSHWQYNWKTMRLLLRYGAPSGFNLFAELFVFTWFAFVVGGMGELPLSATNIAFSIHSIAFMPTLGFNVAVSSLVGNAMGAGNPKRAVRATRRTLHVTMLWMITVGILFLTVPQMFVDVFVPEGMGAAAYAPVHELACTLLLFVTVYCLFDSFTVVYAGALKGAGDTNFVMWNFAGTGLFALIVPAYALKLLGFWNLYILWTLLTFYGFSLAVCFYIRYGQGKWQRLRILDEAS
ncbi:MAG: MATE family efflux transporter [Pseudomonadota bacterium]